MASFIAHVENIKSFINHNHLPGGELPSELEENYSSVNSIYYEFKIQNTFTYNMYIKLQLLALLTGFLNSYKLNSTKLTQPFI